MPLLRRRDYFLELAGHSLHAAWHGAHTVHLLLVLASGVAIVVWAINMEHYAFAVALPLFAFLCIFVGALFENAYQMHLKEQKGREEETALREAGKASHEEEKVALQEQANQQAIKHVAELAAQRSAEQARQPNPAFAPLRHAIQNFITRNEELVARLGVGEVEAISEGIVLGRDMKDYYESHLRAYPNIAPDFRPGASPTRDAGVMRNQCQERIRVLREVLAMLS